MHYDATPAWPQRLTRLPILLPILLVLWASIGIALHYSIDGLDWQPRAGDHGLRFLVACCAFFTVALIPLSFWYRTSWLIYAVALLLLIAVEMVGTVGMGAQRWLNLGFMRLQPSEIMKIALILALARYFHNATPEEVRRPLFIFPALLLIAIPTALVLKQPDLGTAMLLVMEGLALLLLVGVPLWWFIAGGGITAACLPIIWQYGLHDYQKRRVTTFLDPTQDPLGAGYHITQSKIALGSGGLSGRGYGQGPQSQLNFLPEKHTDFIFAVLAEEGGLIGSLALLALAGFILLTTFHIARHSSQHFGRLLCAGIGVIFFLYVFINIGMVIGLLPVVGVPLPMISHGGTAMLTIMGAFGLVASNKSCSR